MTRDITLSYGSTSVVLNDIQVSTLQPRRQKNYYEHVLENGDIKIDVDNTIKRNWRFQVDTPLTSGQLTNLETLYNIAAPITLNEDWIESDVNYTVFFINYEKLRETNNGSDRLILEFRET